MTIDWAACKKYEEYARKADIRARKRKYSKQYYQDHKKELQEYARKRYKKKIKKDQAPLTEKQKRSRKYYQDHKEVAKEYNRLRYLVKKEYREALEKLSEKRRKGDRERYEELTRQYDLKLRSFWKERCLKKKGERR